MNILAVSWGCEVPTPALRMAATLSKEMSAELHVAHIWDLPLVCAPVFIEPTCYERQEEDARRFMEAAVRTAEAAGGIVAKTHVRMGWPVGEVPRLSGEIGADMVIMGKQRRGIVKRLLLGCEVERIARYAPCPVLLVGQEGPTVSLA